MSIIKDLKSNKNIFITAKEFAKKYNVSTKTIYNDIEVINEEFAVLGIEINKIPRKGIILKTENSETHKLSNWLSLKTSMFANKKYSQEDRMDYLIKYIFFDNYNFSLEDLAEALFVSDSTIKRDLEDLEFLSSDYSFSFLNEGNKLKIIGNESEIRRFLREYLSKIILSVYSNEDSKHIDDYLSKIFFVNDIKAVKKSINKILSSYDQNLENYYYSIVIELLIILHRNMKGYYVEDFNNLVIKNLKHLEVYFCASELLNEVSENGYNLNLDGTSEIEAMSYTLLAAGFRITSISYNRSLISDVNQLINSVSNLLSMNLNKDKHLRKMLINHIGPMIIRIKNRTTLFNPLLDDIKKQYNVLYSIIWFSITDLERKYDIKLTASEVSLLVVHFQIALEKLTNPLKILVVCPHSLATSELIISKLKNIFSETDVIEKISVSELNELEIRNADLIITTIHLKKESNNVEHVSPIITESELEQIQKKYLKLRSIESKKSFLSDYESNYMSKLLNELINDSVYFYDGFESKNECLEFLISQCEVINTDSFKFKESIIEREKMGSTSVYTGVAIPHADPRFVKQSQFLIARLRKPIQWDLNSVRIIVLIAISEKDTIIFKDLLVKLLQTLGEPNVIKDLLNKNKENDFKDSLIKHVFN